MFNNTPSTNRSAAGTPPSYKHEGYVFKQHINQLIENWDTKNVTDMEYMFKDTSFNKPIEIDVSSVINMAGMFRNSLQPTAWRLECLFRKEYGEHVP